MIGSNQSYRHDVLSGDNGRIRSHGDDGIKVSRRQSVGEITEVIGKECANQCKLCAKRRLDQVGLAIDLNFLLALFDDRANAGNGMDPPCSCLTQPKACMGLRESGASHATRNFQH